MQGALNLNHKPCHIVEIFANKKGRKNRLLYIWQTDTGEKYLKNGEEKETVLEKEAFWKLLEGEKQ